MGFDASNLIYKSENSDAKKPSSKRMLRGAQKCGIVGPTACRPMGPVACRPEGRPRGRRARPRPVHGHARPMRVRARCSAALHMVHHGPMVHRRRRGSATCFSSDSHGPL